MARIYGGAYRGPDGIYHYGYTDDLTGERGEDLSFDPPEMFGPANLSQADYSWKPPDPWLGVAATGAGLPLNQPIPGGFTAPGATPAAALAGATLNGQPIGPGAGAPARPAAGTALPGGGRQAYSNWGKDPVAIRPEYVSQLGNTALLPGYLQGSGEYNQFRLDQPGLIGDVMGVPTNLRYGLGGTGDPTTGREPQTDARWTGRLGADWMNKPAVSLGGTPASGGTSGIVPVSQGGPYVNYNLFPGGGTGGGGTGGGADSAFSWQGNLQGEYAPLATLFGRSDTETGISTPAQNAPDQWYQLLYKAIRNGTVQVNPLGWQFLQQTKGVTPNQIGGAALTGSNPGAGASAAGAGTGFAEGSFQNPDVMNAITSAAQVAYQRTYAEWQARNGDEQLALAKAKQAADEAYRTATLAFQQQQQQQNVGIQASQLMASLRGPANAFAAANALYGLNRTTGVPNAVAALAGEYNVPAFQAPQSLPQAASLQTLSQQLGAAGTGSGADMTSQAQQFAAGLPTPNKVVGRQYAGLSPDTQQLVLAGYESLGYSPEDTLATIKAGLPQFQAPKFGAVA
jgi:hypothetical protein